MKLTYVCGEGGIHYFPVPGLASLQVHVYGQCLEYQQVLPKVSAAGTKDFNNSNRIHSGVV